jgi:hypothetical protein
VIRCFQNDLFSKRTYHDFERNCPTTPVELHDMMARWADQEDGRMIASLSATTTSRATATTTSTRDSCSTRETPESAS